MDGDLESDTGRWAFDENQDVIDVDGVGSINLTQSNSTVTNKELTILKLKENKFWYKFENGGDTHEFHLVTKE